MHTTLLRSIRRRLAKIRKITEEKRLNSKEEFQNPWGHFQQVDLWSSEEDDTSINLKIKTRDLEPKKKEMSSMLKQMLFDAVVKQNSSFVNQLMKRF